MIYRVFLILFLLPALASAATLSVPSNAVQTAQNTAADSELRLVDAPIDDASDPSGPIIEGTVTTRAWRIDASGLTPKQMTTPLVEQLAEQGFSTVFECSAAQCGGFDFRFALDVISPPAMFVDLGSYRFVSLRNGDMGVTILASAAQSTAFIQIAQVSKDELIETEATANTVTGDPATASLGKTTAPLAQRLKIHGFAELHGLSFMTGSATLTDPRAPVLGALADYLRAHPNQQIALVGHTDSQGALNGNIALSKKRAEAVLETLVSDFNVPRAQMDAQGMGYLSPIASNLTAQGREANRRVEVIVTSTQ